MLSRTTLCTIVIILIHLFFSQSFAQNTLKKEILWTTDWSPDGKYIAIGGNTDTLKIYRERKLKPYRSFFIKSTITRIKWHPSKNSIAVTTQMSDEKSCIINLKTNERKDLKGISPEGARGLDWNHTGDYLAVADNDGQILIYNNSGDLIRKFKNESNTTKGITGIVWHPQKNILTTIADKIRFFDMDGNLLFTIKHRPEAVLLLSIAWHQSGDFFVTGDYGDEKDKSLLQYWDAKGNLLKTIDRSKSEYRNLSWNAKGNRLATASDALRIWDTKGNLIAEGYSNDNLWGVSWNTKGNKIITSSMEQKIILWNKKAKRIKTIE